MCARGKKREEKRKSCAVFSAHCFVLIFLFCLSSMQIVFLCVLFFPHKIDADCSALRRNTATAPISFSLVMTFDTTTETQLFCKENKKLSSTVTRYFWPRSPPIHLDSFFFFNANHCRRRGDQSVCAVAHCHSFSVHELCTLMALARLVAR